MWFGLVTLFPEMLSALNSGITGRALSAGQIKLHHWNPRDFATGARRNVDDRPYGGGPGMLMMVEPLLGALRAAKQKAPGTPKVIFLSPQGRTFNHSAAEAFAKADSLIFVAGRYEGIDERLLQIEAGEKWSVGDYVVSGGELPAMIMMDAVTRLIPGTLGHAASAGQDSLSTGLLEYPQFTRPEQVGGLSVPDVLMSGDHQAIERWRLKAALGRTWLERPDLLAGRAYSVLEAELLTEFQREHERETADRDKA